MKARIEVAWQQPACVVGGCMLLVDCALHPLGWGSVDLEPEH